MNSRNALSICFIAAGALLAASAHAQSPANPASPGASTPAAPAANAPATSAQSGTAAAKQGAAHGKKHAMTHAKSHHAMHKQMTHATPAPDPDTAYRMALKQCVQGPPAQKDSCIDQTIARFGRA